MKIWLGRLKFVLRTRHIIFVMISRVARKHNSNATLSPAAKACLMLPYREAVLFVKLYAQNCELNSTVLVSRLCHPQSLCLAFGGVSLSISQLRNK
jgi:hypothetical protein